MNRATPEIFRDSGRFVSPQLLGSALLSSIWSAGDLNLGGRTVAIKILNHSSPPRSFDDFKTEFLNMARCRHPRLVEVIEMGSFGGSRYYTMDYIDGSVISFESGNLPQFMIHTFGLCQGFEYLHAMNLVHGRFSRSKAMIMNGTAISSSAVKILDYGGNGQAPNSGNSPDAERYAAPEVMDGNPPDKVSDLFTLGAVLLDSLLEGEIEHYFDRNQPISNRLLTDRLPWMTEPVLRILLGMVAPDRSRRYHRIEDVILSMDHLGNLWTGQERPPVILTSSEGCFVDREKEMDRCLRIWQDTCRKRNVGAAVLIDGFSGIGKSRFLRELTAVFRSEQWPVVEARCTSPELRFGPFPEAVRSLQTLVIDRSFHPDQQIGEWLNPQTGDTRPGISRKDPQQMNMVVADYITRHSRHRPFVLVLRDLHLSDPAGIELFHIVLQKLSTVPIFLIGELRISESPRSLQNIIRQSAETGFLQILRIGKLDDRHIRELTSSILGGGQIPESLHQHIIKGSHGIPLFAEELFRLLLQEHVLLRRHGGWVFHEDKTTVIHTPRRVREIMRLRLKQLDRIMQKVVQVLAVFVHPATLDVILTLVPESARQPWILDQLVQMGVLESFTLHQRTQYQFLHSSLPDIILESISRERRRMLHQAVADYLESKHSDEEEVAFHLLRGRTSRRAAETALKAAVKCLHTGAVERAEKLLTSAATKLNEKNKELRTWIRYYQTYVAILRNNVEEILRFAEDGMRHMPLRFPDRIHLSIKFWIFLAEGYTRRGDFDTALEWFRHAEMKALPDRVHELAELYSRRSGTYLFQGRLDLASTDAERAERYIHMLPPSPDIRQMLGNTYNVQGRIAHLSGHPDDALTHYQKARSIGEELGYFHWLASIDSNLGGLYNFLGDPIKSRDHLLQAKSNFKNAGLTLSMAGAENNLGELYFNLGQNSTACRFFDSAYDLFSQSNRRGNQLFVLANLIRVDIEQWQLDRAGDRLQKMSQLASEVLTPDIRISYLHLNGLYLFHTSQLYQAYRSYWEGLGLARRHHLTLQVARSHVLLCNILLEMNCLGNARRHAVLGIRNAIKVSSYRDMVDGCIGLSKFYRYSGKSELAEKSLDHAEDKLSSRHDPKLRFLIDLERLKLRLETRSKEELEPRVSQLRQKITEFQNFAMESELEIVASKCLAKLGYPELAARNIDPCHVQASRNGHTWYNWQLSRLKARFLFDAGLRMSARLEYESAIQAVRKISEQIAHSRLKACFESRRDIRTLSIGAERCVSYLAQDEPFHALEFPGRRDPAGISEPPIQLIGQTIRQLLSTMDFTEILTQIARIVKQLADGDSGFVILAEDDGSLAVHASQLDSPDRDQNLRERLALHASRLAVESRKTVTSTDVYNDTRFLETQLYKPLGIRSLVVVPILSKTKLIGTLYADSRVPGARTILKNKEIYRFFSDIAALTIENARLYTDLDSIFFGLISSLAAAIDAKDPYTRGHSQRVRDYAMAIADEIGLPGDLRRNLELAAFLHDIGKIGIPEVILLQPGPLDAEQREIMNHHPEIGAEIISQIHQLSQVARIVLQHHEHYDGRGYPNHAVTDDIALEARILSTADALDAITSSRPYRGQRSLEAALAEIRKNTGSQFDPRCVSALEKAVVKGWIKIDYNP